MACAIFFPRRAEGGGGGLRGRGKGGGRRSDLPAVIIFDGGKAELLANVVAQVYAYLLQHPFNDPVGLALYVELRCMAASLMLGEWYE